MNVTILKVKIYFALVLFYDSCIQLWKDYQLAISLKSQAGWLIFGKENNVNLFLCIKLLVSFPCFRVYLVLRSLSVKRKKKSSYGSISPYSQIAYFLYIWKFSMGNIYLISKFLNNLKDFIIWFCNWHFIYFLCTSYIYLTYAFNTSQALDRYIDRYLTFSCPLTLHW